MSKMDVLKLYKLLLRESAKFPSYNFRLYAVRRVKDAFRANKSVTDVATIDDQIADGYRNLGVIKRQVAISGMFDVQKLVIERR